MRKALVYGAVLIGLYIAVANATGTGTLITDSFNGGTTAVKTLQGR